MKHVVRKKLQTGLSLMQMLLLVGTIGAAVAVAAHYLR
jgi:hypothetical protein